MRVIGEDELLRQYLGIVRLPNHAVDNFAVQFSN